MSGTGSGRGNGISISNYGGYGGRTTSGTNFPPVGRAGYYGFEQQTIEGTTWTWIPTRQRWEASGGTLYNEQLNKNPEQVRQEVLASGGSAAEAQAARDRQVRDLTNPTSNYLYGSSVTTGAGTEIVDNQSEISALEQIVQKTSGAGAGGRDEYNRATEALQNNAAYQANQGSGRGSGNQGVIEDDDDIIDEVTQTTTPPRSSGVGSGTSSGRGSGGGRTRRTITRGKTTSNGSKKSNTNYPSVGVSDLFKKVDTRLPRVTITNTYPQLEDRNLTQSQFLAGVRRAYKKGILRGSGDRGSGSGSGAGSGTGVNHTAYSPNGGIHVNTYNRLGSLWGVPNSSIKLPRPFGNIDTEWTSYTLVSKNLEGRDTSIRFFVRFKDSGNVYISRQLQLDLNYANRNGNPYFTSHLIPTIELDKFKLNQLWESFKPEETRWSSWTIGQDQIPGSVNYLPIADSLGTESGTTGEIEIFKYIDSLLKSPPTGISSPDFIEPYRKGTVIETAWYSSNPSGFGMTQSQEEVRGRTDGGASSGVGSGTSSGVGAGSTTSPPRSSGVGSGTGSGGTRTGTGSGGIGSGRGTTGTPNDEYDPYRDRYDDQDDRDRY